MTESDRATVMAVDARDVLALTMYGEARGELIEGLIAVGCVVRNRMLTGYRGRTYHEVCLAPLQFSCWNDGDPNQRRLVTLARDLDDATISDEVLRECVFLAGGLVTNQIRDTIAGARHYHARMAMPPAWARGLEPVRIVGHHFFYVGIA